MSYINTVLIADDSNTHLIHLKNILEAAGYKTITAHSGNEAVELCETNKPDLIMLDIVMDNGDGYKACRSIKKNPALSNTPIIMVSAKSNPVDQQWAKQLGATDYIVKPYEKTDILNTLAVL